VLGVAHESSDPPKNVLPRGVRGGQKGGWRYEREVGVREVEAADGDDVGAADL
jgi:hypothetical protein